MSKQIDPDLKGLTTLSLSSYQINRPNKGIISIGSARTLKECGFEDYKQARVEKLIPDLKPNTKPFLQQLKELIADPMSLFN